MDGILGRVMESYRVARRANLLHLRVEPDREPAQKVSETVVSVAKHHQRLDARVQGDGDIFRGGMHDSGTLGVANQRKGLLWASSGLRLEAIHDVLGALASAGDDVGAGGILKKSDETTQEHTMASDTHLNRISPGAGKLDSRVANNRVTNDDAELAAASFPVGLARSASWVVC